MKWEVAEAAKQFVRRQKNHKQNKTPQTPTKQTTQQNLVTVNPLRCYF